MEVSSRAGQGLLSLPNEILLSIFNVFDTQDLLAFAPACHHFHSLILRLLHHRLMAATNLAGYTLYLGCHHPSARLTADHFFCVPTETQGLKESPEQSLTGVELGGQITRLRSLYTRFRPQRNEPQFKVIPQHPAGDVPGSRTYIAPGQTPNAKELEPNEKVVDTVTVDANDLFTQMTTGAYLGKRESRRGLLMSIQNVTDGTIRVWRDWLSKQCETRTFSDHTLISVQNDGSSDRVAGKAQARAESATAHANPTLDPNILWVNTRDDNLGLRLKVIAQRKRATAMPLIYSNEIEVAVSYVVQFEEVYVRTYHLLTKLEEAHRQLNNDSGKAIVFGSYRETQV